MARLTTAQRNALPASDFAGPNRSYPINDAAHARAAKSRASQFASAALRKKVDAKANKMLKGSDASVMARAVKGGK